MVEEVRLTCILGGRLESAQERSLYGGRRLSYPVTVNCPKTNSVHSSPEAAELARRRFQNCGD